MCMGGQPEAPVNTPSYAPEDANKHFVTTVKKEDGTVDAITPPETSVKPTVKPAIRPIRM